MESSLCGGVVVLLFYAPVHCCGRQEPKVSIFAFFFSVLSLYNDNYHRFKRASTGDIESFSSFFMIFKSETSMPSLNFN